MTDDARSILIDARVNGFPGAHGLARSVVRLAEHLGSGEDGLPVRVLVNPGREQIFSLARLSESAELIGTDITFGAVHRCAELARLIRACGAAVLYVPHPMLRPLRCPCPTVVTLHDCTIERDVRFAAGRHLQLGQRLFTRAVLSRATAVTTPTKASLAEVLQFYPTAPNLTVISNGVDPRPFAEVTADQVAAARDMYRLPGSFILAVGAHRPHKNYAVLVRAMTAVPPPTSLVIVGYLDPNFRQSVPRLVADLGLAERVHLVPSVDDHLLPAVFRAASAFALPSLAEGFGLAALEAMAAGVPVVASAIDVLTEVCSGAAMLVPADDERAWASALVRVLAGGPVVADLVAAGAGVVAAAGWERGGHALRELLSRVARGQWPHATPHAQGSRRAPLAAGPGVAELTSDPDRPGSWTLLVDGTPQSHVDLQDPQYLEFEYMRRLGHLVDLAASAGEPLRVLHLGAGGLTLARYVVATRPGSVQLAVDSDAALVELVRRRLPLAQPGRRVSRTGAGRVRVRISDARAVLEQLAAGSFDLVVADLFAGPRTPAHLTSAEFDAEAARVAGPSGTYAINIGDGAPLAHARARAAAVRAIYPSACLIADPAVLRGRRFGNLVLAAAHHDLPLAGLTRRVAGDPFPGRIIHGTELDRFASGARPVTDVRAQDSPAPPADLFAATRRHPR